jgi:hypothetical protein
MQRECLSTEYGVDGLTRAIRRARALLAWGWEMMQTRTWTQAAWSHRNKGRPTQSSLRDHRAILRRDLHNTTIKESSTSSTLSKSLTVQLNMLYNTYISCIHQKGFWE